MHFRDSELFRLEQFQYPDITEGSWSLKPAEYQIYFIDFAL
jgi:hypothetical protein